MERVEYVYHFVLPKEWKKYEDQTFYNPPSLETEGFIHCCLDKQFKHVLGNYFKTAKEVYVLKIHVPSLKVEMYIEPVENQFFPHIYGEIDGDAIEEIIVLKM